MKINPSVPFRFRLANPAASDVQLYVYTYGQEDERYGVHVEYLNLEETNNSDTVEILDNVSFEALVELMLTNLELSITRRAE